MRIYLHSDNAEKQERYPVNVAPAGDVDFVASKDVIADWAFADGRPKQFEIIFRYGIADVADELGKYMTARGIAHRSRLIRRVRQLFNKDGTPIDEVYDERGAPVLLDRVSA